MNKYFLRMVALILVPCLLVDPSLAAKLDRVGASGSFTVSTYRNQFEQQAITQFSGWVGVTRLYRRLTGKDRGDSIRVSAGAPKIVRNPPPVSGARIWRTKTSRFLWQRIARSSFFKEYLLPDVVMLKILEGFEWNNVPLAQAKEVEEELIRIVQDTHFPKNRARALLLLQNSGVVSLDLENILRNHWQDWEDPSRFRALLLLGRMTHRGLPYLKEVLEQILSDYIGFGTSHEQKDEAWMQRRESEGASDWLSRHAAGFLPIREAPDRLTRLVYVLTLLRTLYQPDIGNGVSLEFFNPLADVERQPTTFRIQTGPERRLLLNSITESYRRHYAIGAAVSHPAEAMELKIAGNLPGRAKIFPAHIELSDDMTRLYPEDPGVARALFYEEIKAAPWLYGHPPVSDRLTLTAFVYRRSRRLPNMDTRDWLHIARQTHKTVEELKKSAVCRGYVTLIRIHQLGWLLDSADGLRNDCHAENLAVMEENGRVEFVSDFGAAERISDPMAADILQRRKGEMENLFYHFPAGQKKVMVLDNSVDESMFLEIVRELVHGEIIRVQAVENGNWAQVLKARARIVRAALVTLGHDKGREALLNALHAVEGGRDTMRLENPFDEQVLKMVLSEAQSNTENIRTSIETLTNGRSAAALSHEEQEKQRSKRGSSADRGKSRKPIGSHVVIEEELDNAKDAFRRQQRIDEVFRSGPLEEFSSLVRPAELEALANTLVPGPQATSPGFQMAFPHFSQELAFIQRLMHGEDVRAVLSEVQTFYQSNRTLPDVESIQVREMSESLNDWDTKLPIRAAATLEEGILHVYISPLDFGANPKDRLESALDVFHELYEYLIVPLDPTLTTAQLDVNVPHTLAVSAETAFGDSLRTERARRQLFEQMPLGSSTGEPGPRGHFLAKTMTLAEFLGAYDDVMGEIKDEKFPISSDMPDVGLTKARQAYALSHARELHQRVEQARTLEGHPPLDLEYRARILRTNYLKRRTYPAAIKRAKGWLAQMEESLASELHQAKIDAVAYAEHLELGLTDPVIGPMINEAVRKFTETVVERSDRHASAYFHEMLDKSFRNVVRKLDPGFKAGRLYRLTGPQSGAKPLTPPEALALPMLAREQDDQDVLVWNPKKTQGGDWEFLTVWEVRRAINQDHPPRILALASEGKIEFVWDLTEDPRPSPAAAPKEKPEGTPAQGLRVIYENFKDRTFTFREFLAKRKGYSATTARMELRMLERNGLIQVDRSAPTYRYSIEEKVRALSPPQLKVIASLPPLKRYKVPPSAIKTLRTQIATLIQPSVDMSRTLTWSTPLSEVSAAMCSHREGRPVRGYAAYPAAGRGDMTSMKDIFTLFPDLDGMVLVDTFYDDPHVRKSLWESLKGHGFEVESGTPPENLLFDKKLPRDGLEFKVNWRGRPVRVLLYASDYLDAHALNYLKPEHIKSKIPDFDGFAVSIAKNPGWGGEMAFPETRAGRRKTYYRRMIQEARADSFIYVRDAFPPPAGEVSKAFFQLLFPSGYQVNPEKQVDSYEYLIYERHSRSAAAPAARRPRGLRSGA